MQMDTKPRKKHTSGTSETNAYYSRPVQMDEDDDSDSDAMYESNQTQFSIVLVMLVILFVLFISTGGY